ncbi:MAG: HPr-rel-A system PqqD family peptide chaperone [Gammaproteobacteria bacterium]|nr:HPr-rel-A system PqqD family peptide chaperone [Gammaproteobacteria bacterium]
MSACSWESAHFIFHPASGQTHFLNDTCVEILTLLARERLDTQTIYRRLLLTSALEEDSDFRSGVVSVIQLLDQLGLIESVA